MSPLVEGALIAVIAAYGLLAIYFASLRPLAVATLSPSVSLATPTTLDTDAWSRHDVAPFSYAFASPPGWVVDLDDPTDVRLGRSAKEMALAPSQGEGIAIEAVGLGERQEAQNLAAEDFAGSRPALYDVSVDGVPALFAVAFENGRVRRQAVYVPLGDVVLIARAAWVDPSVFAAFVSTLKFYAPES